MPVERKEPDRVRLMDAFLKETQAFSVLFRLGVIGRLEWRAWLRQEYNIPLADVPMESVPDMSDVAGLPDLVASLVDERMSATYFETENGSENVEAEQEMELTEDELQRLAEEA